MKIIGIIPARIGSQRFPSKPLALLRGIPMIIHVCQRVSLATQLDDFWVATDHEEIKQIVERHGFKALMTDSELPSGTDRCAQAIEKNNISADILINIQGDEPFIIPSYIDTLAHSMKTSSAPIGTLIHAIDAEEDIFQSNTVKVTISIEGKAMYFSRSPIPYIRGIENDWHKKHTFYRHIGMYAYQYNTLLQLSKLSKGSLESAESLEQLRWLEHGFQIQTAITGPSPFGVDTAEDLARAEIEYDIWKNIL